jgi:hypothetical protein
MATSFRHSGERGDEASVGSSPGLVYACALAAMSVGYLAIFAFTRDVGPGRLLVLTMRNMVSLVLVAGAARAVLLRFVEPLSPPSRIPAHLAGAACFTLIWYWVLTVLAGLFDGASATEFSVKPFLLGPGAEWQLFQGLSVYAVVALLVEREPAGARPVGATAEFTAPPAPEPQATTRMLVRMGDEIVAVEPGEIVSITGADDYAELTLATARHLVRTTLAEFEDALPVERFLRVHRSAIVNLDRVVRAEPAGGGRMSLHMESGPVIPASRAGARALRERLI